MCKFVFVGWIIVFYRYMTYRIRCRYIGCDRGGCFGWYKCQEEFLGFQLTVEIDDGKHGYT